MAIAQTEKRHVSARGFDLRPMGEALDILATAQIGAAWSVRAAFNDIAQAAKAAAATLANGGKIAYAAAGSSALMAMADALELPGTYGIDRERIKILIAGGMSGLAVSLAGASEDDELQAARDVADAGIGAGDLLITVSASGTTAYALGAMAAARGRGAIVVGMANNADTPVLLGADIAICLPTPPEVIAGSTRMGAGTAQKIALNMLSTMMATQLGHVHDGYMVNVIADNVKLRERARRIVAAVTGVDEEKANASLEIARGSVKVAIMLAAGADGVAVARGLLDRARGQLRPALAMLEGEERSAERSAL